jgi:ABC-type siderophore export system fused ATPase/permease subunit
VMRSSNALQIMSHDDRYYGVEDRIINLDYGRIDYDGPVTYANRATAVVFQN